MDKDINLFSGYRHAIDKRLSDFLSGQTERSRYSREKSKYPYSLYDPVNYIMSVSGKRIRPLMTVLACETFGGNPEDALDAAVAMEILHNFTLVHDDIMDNASTRRGRETIHMKWDVNSAILAGDELIGLSYRSLLRTKSGRISEIVKAFTDGVIEVCEGQALDKEFERSIDVSLSDYIFMIKKKTAELLKTSAVVGAIIGGADEAELGTINDYSENIGLAFQINDDLLDVIADEGEFGKKIGGDILEKKKTYLYLKTLDLMPGNKKEEFIKVYDSANKSFDAVQKIIGIYNDVCAVESAKSEIKKYTDKANESLSFVKSVESQNKLKKFSDMLLNRNH
jgi:geranylgeranyl diphosphate synthase type II